MAKKTHHVYVELRDKTHEYIFRTDGLRRGSTGKVSGWYVRGAKVCRCCTHREEDSYIRLGNSGKVSDYPRRWSKEIREKLAAALVRELTARGHMGAKKKPAKKEKVPARKAKTQTKSRRHVASAPKAPTNTAPQSEGEQGKLQFSEVPPGTEFTFDGAEQSVPAVFGDVEQQNEQAGEAPPVVS